MTDPTLIQHAQPVIQHAAPVAHAAVKHAAAALPTISHGVSMFTTVLVGIASAVVAGVAGFYTSKLSLFSKAQTVQATVTKDVSNAKAEVTKIEGEVKSAAHIAA